MKALLFSLMAILMACYGDNTSIGNESATGTDVVSDGNHSYWFKGTAEISSYKLSQARYGEMREGNAVLVFVSEPFSKTEFVKADNPDKTSTSVLKLNFTKKFNTGIYPYSMMTSTFFPFEKAERSLKISSSSQEWCGHTYMELLGKDKLEITTNSYFQGESESISLDKSLLEDDVWSRIRLHPNKLPEGEGSMVPSFFYLRLNHQETKSYNCKFEKDVVNDSVSMYKISYPELDRSLTINYKDEYPHQIISWTENHWSGFGSNRTQLTTSGELMKTMNVDYWNKNSKKHDGLRKELLLE